MKRWWWGYFTGWSLFWILFWTRAFFVDETGSIVAGHVNIWGDWAAHLTMTTYLIERWQQLPQSPFLITATFSYPFAVNAISAVLASTGIALFPSMIVVSLFGCMLSVAAVWWWFAAWLKKPAAVFLATLIFMCNGGIGWWYFAQDIAKSPDPLFTLMNPPHEYTRLDSQQIKWISILDSMFIPQRAFVLGLPMAIVVLLLVHHAFQLIPIEKDHHHKTLSSKNKRYYLIAAGLLYGSLPIVHTHSWMATGFILGWWGLASLWRELPDWRRVVGIILTWCWFGIPALALSLPIFMTFFGSQVQHEGFLQWYPGWLSREYHMNWLWFWWKNWSITPILALIGGIWWIWQEKNHRVYRALLLAPFYVLFVIANLVLPQPFPWDNTKLFVWTSMGWAAMVAFLLNVLWEESKRHRHVWQTKFWRLLVLGLVFLTVASGVIDAYWILRVDLHSFRMYSEDDMRLVAWTKANTAPTSRWLTGDQHNHWLFNLTGRQALMTYRGWLWSHGYAYREVESDVAKMFSDPAANQALFDHYQVNYIVVGPNEREVWHANETAISELFPKVAQTTGITIYRVKPDDFMSADESKP